MSPDALAACLAPGAGLPALSPRDWETLLAQARCASLMPALALACQRSPGWAEVPAGPRWHFDAALRASERLAFDMSLEIERIEAALAGAGLRCVLLKGAAYLASGLPPAEGRLFGDIDLIVPRADLAAAENALLGAGWICSELDAYTQRYYREWMHEIPPLSHIQRGTVIDLHHTITPPTSAFQVAGQVLLDAVQPVSGTANVWTLQPVDMVLHSAVHLFSEGEFDSGLRDLLDLHKLLLHFGTQPAFWPALFDRADELGLQAPLHHALVHVRRLLGPVVPQAHAAAEQRLAPPAARRWLLARLLALALRPDHASTATAFSGLARGLLYLRAHGLRMPLGLLLPHLARKAWLRQFPGQKPAP